MSRRAFYIISAIGLLLCLVVCGQESDEDIPFYFVDGAADFSMDVAFESPFTRPASGNIQCNMPGGCDVYIDATLSQETVQALQSKEFTGNVVKIELTDEKEWTWTNYVSNDELVQSFPHLKMNSGNYRLRVSVVSEVYDSFVETISLSLEVRKNEPEVETEMHLSLRNGGAPQAISFSCDYPEGCDFSLDLRVDLSSLVSEDEGGYLVGNLHRPDGVVVTETISLNKQHGYLRLQFEDQPSGIYRLELLVEDLDNDSEYIYLACYVHLEGAIEEVCDSAIDEDHDGAIGCEDNDCRPDSICVQADLCRLNSDPCSCIADGPCIWLERPDDIAHGCINLEASELCQTDCYYSLLDVEESYLSCP